jgi:O-antigen/teichoic acid export membrane protein
VNLISEKILGILRGQNGASTVLQAFLARVSFMVLTIFAGMITARYLGPTGRGELAAMGLWPQFLAFIATLGLTSSLIYNYKRYPERKAELFGAALVLGVILGSAAALIGFIFIPIWLAQSPPLIIQVARWFVLTAVLDMLSGVACAALEAEGKFGFANQIRYVSSPIFSLIVLLVLIKLGSLTAVNAVIVGIFPKVLLCLWVVGYAWKIINPQFIRLLASCQCLMKYGLRSYGLDVLGTLSGKIDQLFIVSVLAAYDVGIYNAALNLAGLISMLQLSAGSILFPKASARPVKEVVEMTAKTVRITLLVTSVGAVGIIGLGPYLLAFLYGHEFVAAAPIFRILVPYVVLSGTVQILTQPFMALDRPEMATFLQAVSLGVNVLMFMMFVPKYGVYGVVWSLLISTLFQLVAVMMSYPLVLKSKYPNLVPGKADLQKIRQLVTSVNS